MKKELNVTQYQEGIFDICDFLVSDLIKFLKDEGRYKFRMLDYMRTVTEEFSKAHKIQTDEDISIYGRVLYIANRAVMKEFQRLRIKRLTPADAVICIILKLLGVSESLEGGENRFLSEQTKIKEVLQKLHENIRNKAKSDHLWKIENSIKDALAAHRWGTLSLDELDLYSIEHPKEKEPEIQKQKENWGTGGKEIVF